MKPALKPDERKALAALVAKLTEIETNPSFQGIWTYLHVHGYKYTGPDWRDALADARLALAITDDEGVSNGDG